MQFAFFAGVVGPYAGDVAVGANRCYQRGKLLPMLHTLKITAAYSNRTPA